MVFDFRVVRGLPISFSAVFLALGWEIHRRDAKDAETEPVFDFCVVRVLRGLFSVASVRTGLTTRSLPLNSRFALTP